MQIVIITNDQPVTTTIAIAEGTKVEHKNVLELVRRYLEDLKEFGLVAFQTRPRLEGQHGGGATEYAELNEQQATLILTYMRNSEIVRAFKKRLVKEFWEMRAKLAAPPTENDDRVQLHLFVPNRLRQKIRAAALEQGTTIGALAIDLLSKVNEPKAEPVPVPSTQGTLDGVVEREFTAAYHLAQMIGCDANTAALRANAAVLKATGTDVLATLGHTNPVPVKVNTSGYYNPSELMEGVSGRDMNLALKFAGLQTSVNHRWMPTNKGLKYCQAVGGGMIDYKLRWKKEVLNLLPHTENFYQ